MAYISDKNLNPANGIMAHDSVDPLLVNLHDSVCIYKDGGRNVDALIDNVASILDANLTDNETILAADVLISLIKQAQTDIRKSLSERLAPRDDLHPNLLNYLAYDEIDVARDVLLYSPLLNDMDLMLIIETKAAQHWQAIASRDEISNKIVEILIDKKEMETSTNLLSNNTINLDDNNLGKIKKLAILSPQLAEEFISYKTLPRDLAVEIYWHASIALRKSIANKYNVKNAELDRALEDCVQDFNDTIRHEVDLVPSSLMREIAGLYKSQNKISDQILVGVLRRRQGRFFIALFALKTNLDFDTIWNMMRQVGGQGLAVASRAMNISKENFVSIFLLSRTIARSNRSVDAEELRMAMRYYDGLTHKMAKEILENSIA